MSAASAAAAVPVRAGSRAAAAGAAAAGAALVVAVVLATLAAHHAEPSEVSPLVPHGAWNGVWIGSLAAAFVLHGVGAALAWRGRLRLGAAVLVAVVVQATPLAAPLLLSKDVYLYWGEARVLTVHHANPYDRAPADYPGDPALPWISESWRDDAAPYGPAWELVSAAPAAAAGTSQRAAALGYRALAFAAVVAALVLVARRTRSAAAVALLGWSPLVALHFAGGGHGDAVMMALVIAAVAAGATARGGALWPVASAFKPFPPVLVPLELARRRLRVGRRFWVGLAGATAAVVVGATALFGTHWISASTVGAHQSSGLGGVHWLGQLGLGHRQAVLVAGAVFAAVYVVLLRRAWVTGRAPLSLAATALCLTSSLLRPWYALWPLALAAVEEDAVAAVAAYALTGYLLFGDAVTL